MITFTDFSFYYRKKNPLYSHLNLEISPGKIYGLFGKNGAGKSTLLKNITGLNRPTKGKINVNGQSPSDRKPSFLSDLYMIPEEVYIPSISKKNYLKTYGQFYPKFSIEQFESYLIEFEVPPSKSLKDLSFGQQKKFIISFALATNATVLIMDEPTNGLDIPSKAQFRKLMVKTISEEKTYIISTHQITDLNNILDHILIVDSGELLVNLSLYDISKKCAFNFYTTPPSGDNIIDINEIAGGYAVMEKNTNDNETTINLEQFFNVATNKTESIHFLL